MISVTDKAKELFYKYYYEAPESGISDEIDVITAKKYATILVDEILIQADNWGVTSVTGFWNDVKKEIINL